MRIPQCRLWHLLVSVALVAIVSAILAPALRPRPSPLQAALAEVHKRVRYQPVSRTIILVDGSRMTATEPTKMLKSAPLPYVSPWRA